VRVLIAPDSFTGSMSAAQAARAIERGWRTTAPDDQCVLVPLSDGGPGFLAAVASATAGRLVPVATAGPWGAPVSAEILICDGGGIRTAYLESAAAIGDRGVPRGAPGAASTWGISLLLRAALSCGAERIVVGLGGSLTTDGGAGMLVGLGATATDADGFDATEVLRQGGGGLARVAHVDLGEPRRAMAGVELIIASDVEVPLLGPRGAAHGFAAQKGADEPQVEQLESALRSFAHACGRTQDGRSPAVALGAGAAGGLGFALLHLGGRMAAGIDEVLAAVSFDERVAAADLVITGEGSFDWQSLQGKVITGVCRSAMAQGRPVLVLAGRIEVGRREWMAIGVNGAYGIIDRQDATAAVAPVKALAQGPDLLAALAARAARTWSR
jgi:glycerate kinase